MHFPVVSWNLHKTTVELSDVIIFSQKPIKMLDP